MMAVPYFWPASVEIDGFSEEVAAAPLLPCGLYVVPVGIQKTGLDASRSPSSSTCPSKNPAFILYESAGPFGVLRPWRKASGRVSTPVPPLPGAISRFQAFELFWNAPASENAPPPS